MPLYTALAELPRKFPAQQLRRLKEKVSDLVLSQDPKNQLSVVNLADDDKTEDIEVVFGVGVISAMGDIGFKAINSNDIFKDVILDGSLPAEKILSVSLPELMRVTPNSYLPVFKYLVNSERGIGNFEFKLDGLDVRVVQAAERAAPNFEPTQTPSNQRKRERVRANFSSFTDLKKIPELHRTITDAVMLEESKIDVQELGEFLKQHIYILDLRVGVGKVSYVSAFRKLVCLYDYLKYGRMSSSK